MSNIMDSTSIFVQRLTNDVSLQLEGFSIICRKTDGYINATQLCKAGGKIYNNWFQNQRTGIFVHKLSVSTGIPVGSIIKYEDFGPQNRATWVHPRIAINIAQWISVDFDLQVTGWIHELLVCGNVTYGNERSNEAIMQEQLSQMKNTIDQQSLYINQQTLCISQQNEYILQQNTTLVQQSSEIVEKNTTILTLEQKLDKYMKEAEESRKRLEEMVSATNEQLALTHTKLTVTHDQLQSTHEQLVRTHCLLEDVAERAVPVLDDESKLEVVFIYSIKSPDDQMFTNKFTIRGVQEANIKALETSMTKTYKKGNYKLVKSYHRTPNSAMLKNKVREWRHIVKPYHSTFLLINGCTMPEFITRLDTLYDDVY